MSEKIEKTMKNIQRKGNNLTNFMGKPKTLESTMKVASSTRKFPDTAIKPTNDKISRQKKVR